MDSGSPPVHRASTGMFLARLIAATLSVMALVAVVSVATAPSETERGRAKDPWSGPPRRSLPAPALFREHCARCHGEVGDGRGTTELERPARSFLKGGYAYGDTLVAVMRTIDHGIPGTPMPAFGEALTDRERISLARFVLGKGPQARTVGPGEAQLAVEGRPALVYGMAPDPTASGALEPRCLMIGFPRGASFQYRQSDGALLAIRRGDFIDRADWRGSGGAPLRPLGEIEWSADQAARDRVDFVDAATGTALQRAAYRTSVGEGWALLEFRLLDADGATVGSGAERIRFVTADGDDVAVRELRLTGAGDGAALAKMSAGGERGGLRKARVADGLLVAAPIARDDVLVYVHARRWNESLTRSIAELLDRTN